MLLIMKRTILQILTITLIVISLLLTVSCQRTSEEKPNVVHIICDQLSADALNS